MKLFVVVLVLCVCEVLLRLKTKGVIANDCVNHCLAQNTIAYKSNLQSGSMKNNFWCGLNAELYDFEKAAPLCSKRAATEAACEKDSMCFVTSTTTGDVCKGFCGACCSAGHTIATACTQDSGSAKCVYA
jgi:hypothetical protein